MALAVFGIFSTVLLTSWTGLQTDAMNTTSYSIRQNEQMRVMDYIKRDIRRASAISILNSGVTVTGANNYGTVLQLTLPGYYSDTRSEDDAHGTRVANSPTYTAKVVAYGTPLTVQYYSFNGALLRSEGGVLRTLAPATGNFAASFCVDTTGLLRTQLVFDQRMRIGTTRTLRRQVDFLSDRHTQYVK